MWFELGFCILAVSIWWSYQGQNLSWDGQKGVLSDQTTFSYKSKSNQLIIGIEGPPGFQCVFKKETKWDRFFKSLGLSKELQTGIQEFDNSTYIFCDNAQAQRFIAGHSGIGASVLAILSMRLDQFEFKELVIYKGRIYVVYARQDKKTDMPVWVDSVVALLRQLNACFEDAQSFNPTSLVDSFFLRSIVISAISSGLCLNAWIGFLRIRAAYAQDILDFQLIVRDALLGGGILWGLLTLCALVLIGRSSRAHYVYLHTVFLASVGLIVSTYAELYDFNIERDTSVGALYDRVLLDKHVYHSKKSTFYYLTIQAWPDKDLREDIVVSPSTYSHAQIGDPVTIRIKPGQLGYRWISDIQLKPQSINPTSSTH